MISAIHLYVDTRQKGVFHIHVPASYLYVYNSIPPALTGVETRLALTHQPNMGEQDKKTSHSCLELVKHDPSANAPEHDHFAEAPEVNLSAEAPQVGYFEQISVIPYGVSNSGTQIAHQDVPPIPVGEQQESEALAPDSGRKTHTHKLLKKKCVILCLALVAVVAIAIGVAVGTMRSKLATPSQTSAPSQTLSIPSQTMSIPSHTTSFPAPLEHGVLDDSSFAAVTLQDGSRYVFFQDINGSLRQAYYSQTASSWTSDINQIIPNTTDAKSNTPLAAVPLYNSGNDEVKHFDSNLRT